MFDLTGLIDLIFLSMLLTRKALDIGFFLVYFLFVLVLDGNGLKVNLLLGPPSDQGDQDSNRKTKLTVWNLA